MKINWSTLLTLLIIINLMHILNVLKALSGVDLGFKAYNYDIIMHGPLSVYNQALRA